MIKAVIFDMDGTILASNDLVTKIYETLTKIHKPQVHLNSISKEDLLAKGYPEIIKILYPGHHDFYIHEIYKIHEKISKPYLSLYPDTLELLVYLKQLHIQIFLVTSELRSITMNQLKYLNILDYFDEIIAFDDVLEPKPSPLGIHTLLNKYHLNKDLVVFIGDSISDGMAANKAGIKSIYMNHHLDESKVKYFDQEMHMLKEFMDYIDALNPVFKLELQDKSSLNIIQFTDLHLMHDEKDDKTFKLLSHMIKKESPDLILFTGDQTMSKDSVILYSKLHIFMEQFEIPWSFLFGNHDTDYGVSYEALLNTVKKHKYLKFKRGYKKLGYSNFFFEVKFGKNQVGLIFMLDSHIDETYIISDKEQWGYGRILDSQSEWIKDVFRQYEVTNRHVSSIIFQHIPPFEVRSIKKEDTKNYIGVFDESPSTPPVQTNFFNILNALDIKGVFYGHDHYNDFSFTMNNIFMAYGRVSGYYEYLDVSNQKGARLIKFHSKKSIDSKILLYDKNEVS